MSDGPPGEWSDEIWLEHLSQMRALVDAYPGEEFAEGLMFHTMVVLRKKGIEFEPSAGELADVDRFINTHKVF